MRLAAIILAFPAVLAAQTPADVARERQEFNSWLTRSPLSPYAAIARAPIGGGLTIGPADSDVPLPGIPTTRVTEGRGGVRLHAGGGERPVPRHRPVPFSGHRLIVTGEPGRSVVTVYGMPRNAREATFYAYDAALSVVGGMAPPSERRTQRMLTLDGLEVEAVDAGHFVARVAGADVRLPVFRITDPASGEAELTLYFRDATNDAGSYPSGRFLVLVPAGDGRYRADFNRARNPFCAYSSAYACPVPWPGNEIPAPVTAGERYRPTPSPEEDR